MYNDVCRLQNALESIKRNTSEKMKDDDLGTDNVLPVFIFMMIHSNIKIPHQIIEVCTCTSVDNVAV